MNRAVIIEKNGNSTNYKSIMVQISVLKVKIHVLNEVIEYKMNGSKIWEDEISLVKKKVLTVTSTKVSTKHSAMDIAHQDI